MRAFQFLLTVIGFSACQADAGYYGNCAYDCIGSLNITNWSQDDPDWGWNRICGDEPALDAVNSCITSLCSSPDQDSIFAKIAQTCADQGSSITAAPAEATFSVTSRGTLFASGVGRGYSSCASDRGAGNGRGRGDGQHDRVGHCSRTTFTGNWGGWDVSWAGFGHENDCSTTADSTPTAATSPSRGLTSMTGTASLSLGATVTTTIDGVTLTGTIFDAPADAVSATSETAALAAQNGGPARSETMGALVALVVALLAATCML